MEVNFLNKKPCIPSWPGAFQFDILFVLFWVSRCVFRFWGLLQVRLALLKCCLSIQHFRYLSLVPILLPKIARFLLHPVVGMFSCHSLPIVDRISFRCFGKSYFVCTVLPFVDISLIFFLWPVFSGLFPQVIMLFFPVWPVPSFPRLFQHISSSFRLVFVVFLFAIPV